MEKEFIDLKEFYRKQLEEDFFPFWEKAYDEDFGGVYSCFNNESTELISKNKYTWSQGRFLWIVSHLYKMTVQNKLNLDLNKLKEMCDGTFKFLLENVFLENKNSAYALTRKGNKIDFDGKKDISIFADTFVLIGFNAYGRIFNNLNALKEANEILNNIIARIDSGEYLTEPYPVDENFSSHSIPMILSNCLEECIKTNKYTNFKYDLDLEKLLEEKIYTILDYHVQANNTICEFQTEKNNYKDTMLHNHINPGHTIECLWFLIHGFDSLGKENFELSKIKNIFNATLERGLDKQYGGLLRFVDKDDGLKPKGRLINDKFEKLINETWDYKLWWPHSELLYTSLLLYFRSKDKKLIKIYKEAHKYIFNTFPNPDRNIGEWIQIRNRKGEPVNKIVALPVKDPFHIMRNFILIIELLNKEGI